MRRRPRFRALVALVALGVVSAVAVRLVTAGKEVAAGCQAGAGSVSYRLDLEQAANATTVAAVGKRLGLPDHAVTIALAAALQESKLRNLSHGDLDSLGIFQQRPSQGWGTASQVMVPAVKDERRMPCDDVEAFFERMHVRVHMAAFVQRRPPKFSGR